MKSVKSRTRRKQLDDIAVELPVQAEALQRLIVARMKLERLGISRIEGSLLAALTTRPHRVTELAARESITQPAITQLVNRLQQRGWVTRETDPGDRRVVLVTLTAAGHEMHQRMLGSYRALLHEQIATLDDADVEALVRAIEIIDRLIERLSEPTP